MSGLFGAYAPSGTFTFYPSNAEVISSAFSRCRIKRTELEPSHLQDGITELNLFLAAFNTAGPNLAQMDLQTIALSQGVATYPLPASTVMVNDLFLTYPGGGTNGTLDNYLNPLSRTEYAAIPDKALPGRPTQYWLDRLQIPTLTFFPAPDGNGPYTANYYRMRQVQDSTLPGGTTPEVPNRALDALVAGLAYRLARIYPPPGVDPMAFENARKADAGEAWTIYAKQDTENVNLYIMPMLAGYWRK